MSTPLQAPTLQDMIRIVRNMLNQPDPSNSFWSDEELVDYINEAIRIHMAELTDIDEGQFATTATLDIVSGADLVALPSDFFICRALYKVNAGEENILLPYRNNLTESYATDGESTSNVYAPYYYFRGSNIVLRPMPNFAQTGGLLMEYVQLPSSLQDSADTLSVQITALFRQSVEMYAIYKAKLKESLANNIRVDAVAKENFGDLFKQFRDLSAKRSKNPTAIIPFDT